MFALNIRSERRIKLSHASAKKINSLLSDIGLMSLSVMFEWFGVHFFLRRTKGTMYFDCL